MPPKKKQKTSHKANEVPKETRDFRNKWKLVEDGMDKYRDLIEKGMTIQDQGTWVMQPLKPSEFDHMSTAIWELLKNASARDMRNKHIEDLKLSYAAYLVGYLNNYSIRELNAATNSAQGSNTILRRLYFVFSKYKNLNLLFAKVCLHLDNIAGRAFLIHEGLKAFMDHFFVKYKVQIRNQMIDIINKDRNNEGVKEDLPLLKKIVNIFENLGLGTLNVYVNDFEAALLQTSFDFYTQKALLWITEDNTPTFLQKTEEALNSEAARVRSCLNSSTEPKIKNVLLDCLLKNNINTLLEKEGSGLRFQLQEKNSSNLQRIYRLFSQVDKGLEAVSKISEKYFTEMGKNFSVTRDNSIKDIAPGVKNDKSPYDHKFIQQIRELYKTFDKIVLEDFAANAIMQTALRSTMITIMNNCCSGKCNELLANFIDGHLKGTIAKISAEELEETLKDSVVLYSFLHAKDTFMMLARNQMAKRFLDQKNKNDDAEKSFISKLKSCGAPDVNKLEGMIKDFSTSGEGYAEEFSNHTKSQTDLGYSFEFIPLVLTSSYWPTYKTIDMNYPNYMNNAMNVFEKFYKSKSAFSSRKVLWVSELGTCVLKTTYKFPESRKIYDISMNTMQGVCLLLFNNQNSFEFRQLLTALFGDKQEPLSMDATKKIAGSLMKSKLIIKTPASGQINTTDSFKINKAYTNKKNKFGIAPMNSITAQVDTKKIEEGRKFVLEAMIVKIAKSRKQLTHVSLMDETLHQVKSFKVDPKDIKQRIEDLIEREFLGRSEDDRNMYNYIA